MKTSPAVVAALLSYSYAVSITKKHIRDVESMDAYAPTSENAHHLSLNDLPPPEKTLQEAKDLVELSKKA